MKKLLLLSAIVCGSVSFASAQAADVDPAAAKAKAATQKALTNPTDKVTKQNEKAVVAANTGARPSFSKATTVAPAARLKKAAAAKPKVATKAN